jgi:hypothetical protein
MGMGLLLKKGNQNRPSDEAQNLLQPLQDAAEATQNYSPDDDCLALGMLEVG